MKVPGFLSPPRGNLPSPCSPLPQEKEATQSFGKHVALAELPFSLVWSLRSAKRAKPPLQGEPAAPRAVLVQLMPPGAVPATCARAGGGSRAASPAVRPTWRVQQAAPSPGPASAPSGPSGPRRTAHDVTPTGPASPSPSVWASRMTRVFVSMPPQHLHA